MHSKMPGNLGRSVEHSNHDFHVYMVFDFHSYQWVGRGTDPVSFP